MAKREYHQYCGLARAAEVLGQRWTLLIMRDLLVAPRRFSDLAAGLPGIPSNLLSTRLKELEADGLVVREARRGADRSVVYAPTARGLALMPALDALSLWGAGELREPRDGETVTEASLVTALRVAALEGTAPARDAVIAVRVGAAAAHALARDGRITVAPGDHPAPDLRITASPRLRDLLAGELSPHDAVAEGALALDGDASLLDDFAAAFTVPYAP
ncbi:helix-turn-helix domain-containing protein [Glycomyces sp. NPDC047369]